MIFYGSISLCLLNVLFQADGILFHLTHAHCIVVQEIYFIYPCFLYCSTPSEKGLIIEIVVIRYY